MVVVTIVRCLSGLVTLVVLVTVRALALAGFRAAELDLAQVSNLPPTSYLLLTPTGLLLTCAAELDLAQVDLAAELRAGAVDLESVACLGE